MRELVKSICCVATALVAAFLIGCGRNEPSPPNFDRFAPSPDVARAAIEVVLTSWQSGRPLEAVSHLTAELVVTDKHRNEGQELEDFEILGETPGDVKRCFAVRLRLRNPDEEQTVRYVVIGIAPLMVFRHEDLDDLCHWDHPMPAEEKADAAGTKAAREPPGADETPPANASERAETAGIKEE